MSNKTDVKILEYAKIFVEEPIYFQILQDQGKYTFNHKVRNRKYVKYIVNGIFDIVSPQSLMKTPDAVALELIEEARKEIQI